MAKPKAKAAPLKLFLTTGDSTEEFQVALDGKTVTTQSGPRYSSKTKTLTLATPDKAKAKYDQLVADKRVQGYRELGEVDKPTVAIARDEALESAIRERRDDAAPYLVYADWLQAQGSQVGEMLVLAQRNKPKQAMAIASKLGLPSAGLATFGWRFGVWQWLRLDNAVDQMDDTWDPVAFARALFGSPLCVALEDLRIGMLRWNFQDQPDVIAEAGRHGWARDLRGLVVGDVDGNIDMAHHAIGDVGKAISKNFPNLVSLTLHSGAQSWRGTKETFGVAGLDLPKLTDLTIETCAMSGKRMKAVAAANLPALEKLVLWFGARDRDANAKVADVAPVFDRVRFPRLKHLGLRNTELVTDLVRLLPAAKIAKQLETLDLSMGTMSDEDAAELAESAAQFTSLKTLNVDDNFVSASGARQLKAAFKGVAVSAKDPKETYDEDERYVSVSE